MAWLDYNKWQEMLHYFYYTTDEAKEGRDAFKEKRDPDFDQFPKFP